MLSPPEAAHHFLNDLRSARNAALADGENLAPLLTAFERLGFQMLLPNSAPGGLGDYRARLLALAERGRIPDALASDPCEVNAADLFDSVQASRNDEMHVGVSARRLVEHAVRLALFLEAGLMADLHQVKHFMVASPVCAEHWQTVAHVRQTLLLHQFTHLPYRDPVGHGWLLISDHAVASYLYNAPARAKALAAKLEAVIPPGALRTIDASARLKNPTANISTLVDGAEGHLPWLVVDGPEKALRGIITGFDLL